MFSVTDTPNFPSSFMRWCRFEEIFTTFGGYYYRSVRVCPFFAKIFRELTDSLNKDTALLYRYNICVDENKKCKTTPAQNNARTPSGQHIHRQTQLTGPQSVVLCDLSSTLFCGPDVENREENIEIQPDPTCMSAIFSNICAWPLMLNVYTKSHYFNVEKKMKRYNFYRNCFTVE